MKTKNLLFAAVLFLTANCLPARILLIILMAGGLPTFSSAQSAGKEQAVAYTLEDRDRAIRMEVRMDERFESMNARFEAIDDKLNKLYTLIYFILAGVFGLIGLIFWDRRSYIKPVKEDISELQNALRDFAKKQPELAEILRSHGLM